MSRSLQGTKESPKTDLAKLSLVGNVKSFQKTTYRNTANFNTLSQEEKEHSYTARSIVTFNKRGYKTTTSNNSYYLASSRKTVFEYNRKGYKTEEIHYQLDTVFEKKIIFEYDKKGNLIVETTRTKHNDLAIFYKYDENRNLIETTCDKNAQLSSSRAIKWIKYEYDESGNLIEEAFDNWHRKGESSYKYDEHGNNIERKNSSYNYRIHDLNGGNSCDNLFAKYNEKGKPTEWVVYDCDGNFIVKWAFTFDEGGNETEKIRLNADESTYKKYTFKYQFDQQNNWIQKETYENDILISIVERAITYYTKS